MRSFHNALENIFAKQEQLGITFTKLYWIIGRTSKLSTSKQTSHTKQYSNQNEFNECNSGVRILLPT
jgi:hypothetical protein